MRFRADCILCHRTVRCGAEMLFLRILWYGAVPYGTVPYGGHVFIGKIVRCGAIRQTDTEPHRIVEKKTNHDEKP